jgi:hypothetical protein
MFNLKKGENMKKEKIKIVEEPILNLKVEVDRSVNGNHEARMNWPSFTLIDLVDVFMTPLPNEKQTNTLVHEHDVAVKKAKLFKRRLKAYIIDKADKSELENFDWSEWEMV